MGVPIGQRPVYGRPAAGGLEQPTGEPGSSTAPRVRHCWVQHAGGEWPGVVVRWDHVEDQWLATVAWVEDADALRVERVPAHRLRKA